MGIIIYESIGELSDTKQSHQCFIKNCLIEKTKQFSLCALKEEQQKMSVKVQYIIIYSKYI